MSDAEAITIFPFDSWAVISSFNSLATLLTKHDREYENIDWGSYLDVQFSQHYYNFSPASDG